LEDFARELHTGHRAEIVGGVVGEAPFVGVGESAELEEGVVVEEVGVGDGGVVDFGDIDKIEDWLC